MRPTHQTEADIITAVLRVRQARLDEAATALASGLTRLRTDPWPPLRYKQEALNLRFRNATGQLDNTAEIKRVRRQIARINTLIRQREIAAAEAKR